MQSDLDIILGAKDITGPVFEGALKRVDAFAGASSNALLSISDVVDRSVVPSTELMLSSGEKSANVVTSSFEKLASTIGGIPGLLLSIPIGIAGFAFAAVTMASKTEAQLDSLADKLALIEAAKLNISIDAIDTSPLRAVAEEVEGTAKLIQRLTNMKSSSLIDMANRSLSKGMDSNQISEVMKTAVGLSKLYGTSVEEQMGKVQLAIEGNFEAYSKLIPAVDTLATHEEKLAAITLAASNGMKVLDKEASTFWGTIERAKNGIGNVIEYLGRTKSIAEVVGIALRDVVSPVIDYVGESLKGFGIDTVDWMKKITYGAAWVTTAVELMGTKSDLVFDMLKKGSEYAWERLGNEARHMFYQIATVYAPWLATQVTNTMSTMAKNVSIVFDQSMGDMIRQNKLLAGALGAMAGAGVTSAWGALHSAATNAGKKPRVEFKFDALPEVVTRSIGQREKELLDALNESSNRFAEATADTFGKNLSTIQGMMDGLENPFQNSALKPNVPKKVEDPIAQTLERSQARLEVLQSRFMARGPSDDPQKEMVSVLKEQRELLKQIANTRPGGASQAAIPVNAPGLQFVMVDR